MTKKTEVRRCLCGCGEPTSGPKRLFVQGHDAKLAKQVRLIWSGQADKDTVPAEVWELYDKGELKVLDKAKQAMLEAKDSIEVKLERAEAKLRRAQAEVDKLKGELQSAKDRAAEQAKLEQHRQANAKAQAKQEASGQ